MSATFCHYYVPTEKTAQQSAVTNQVYAVLILSDLLALSNSSMLWEAKKTVVPGTDGTEMSSVFRADTRKQAAGFSGRVLRAGR